MTLYWLYLVAVSRHCTLTFLVHSGLHDASKCYLSFSPLQNLNSNSLPLFLGQLSNTTVNLTKEVVESTPTIIAIVDIFANVGERMILLFIPITKTSIEVCQ